MICKMIFLLSLYIILLTLELNNYYSIYYYYIPQSYSFSSTIGGHVLQYDLKLNAIFVICMPSDLYVGSFLIASTFKSTFLSKIFCSSSASMIL